MVPCQGTVPSHRTKCASANRAIEHIMKSSDAMLACNTVLTLNRCLGDPPPQALPLIRCCYANPDIASLGSWEARVTWHCTHTRMSADCPGLLIIVPERYIDNKALLLNHHDSCCLLTCHCRTDACIKHVAPVVLQDKPFQTQLVHSAQALTSHSQAQAQAKVLPAPSECIPDSVAKCSPNMCTECVDKKVLMLTNHVGTTVSGSPVMATPRTVGSESHPIHCHPKLCSPAHPTAHAAPA